MRIGFVTAQDPALERCLVRFSVGTPTILTEASQFLPHFLQVNPGRVSQLCHDHFPRNHFRFVILLSPYHWALHLRHLKCRSCAVECAKWSELNANLVASLTWAQGHLQPTPSHEGKPVQFKQPCFFPTWVSLIGTDSSNPLVKSHVKSNRSTCWAPDRNQRTSDRLAWFQVAECDVWILKVISGPSLWEESSTGNVAGL
jgi:hypothetical protein